MKRLVVILGTSALSGCVAPLIIAVAYAYAAWGAVLTYNTLSGQEVEVRSEKPQVTEADQPLLSSLTHIIVWPTLGEEVAQMANRLSNSELTIVTPHEVSERLEGYEISSHMNNQQRRAIFAEGREYFGAQAVLVITYRGETDQRNIVLAQKAEHADHYTATLYADEPIRTVWQRYFQLVVKGGSSGMDITPQEQEELWAKAASDLVLDALQQ